MPKCKLKLTLPVTITINFQRGEEETIQESVEEMLRGKIPVWMEELILTALEFEEAEVDEMLYSDDEPAPDEELDFD